jgi:hypothetical protein
MIWNPYVESVESVESILFLCSNSDHLSSRCNHIILIYLDTIGVSDHFCRFPSESTASGELRVLLFIKNISTGYEPKRLAVTEH